MKTLKKHWYKLWCITAIAITSVWVLTIITLIKSNA